MQAATNTRLVDQAEGDVVYQQQRVAGHRSLGFAWSLVLSYGDKAEISGPHLRVALVDGFATLDVPKELAPDVRDLLTRASLDWRVSRRRRRHWWNARRCTRFFHWLGR